MAKATNTKIKKATRAHFAIRAIRNANPRTHRSHKAGAILARIFSL